MEIEIENVCERKASDVKPGDVVKIGTLFCLALKNPPIKQSDRSALAFADLRDGEVFLLSKDDLVYSTVRATVRIVE